ncbi:G-protein coupled receptor 35-like [Sardina pilchardus]|uniref:G-protein coupled receptor 35-like n=1 Tax=Sardina pilchardus TaxID=27697 RepID=UPI002E0D7367
MTLSNLTIAEEVQLFQRETHCNLTIGEEVRVFQMVTAIPTFVLGVLVNSAVLVLFCRQWRNCSDMMVYLTNLALADSCVLVSLPFRMYSYQNPWPFSISSCLVFVSTYFVNMYVSIFTTVAISVVRYVAVKYPFRARAVMSPWIALVVCVSIWVYNASVSAAFHSVDKPKGNSSENLSGFKCFQKNSDQPLPLSFIVLLVGVGYALPFIIITFCSGAVIHTLSRKTDIDSDGTQKSKSVNIITANLAIFIVCFSPLHFGYLFKFLCETYSDDCALLQFAHSFVHVASSLASTNCFLDAFSYYFLARGSWGTLKDAFCGTQHKERVNNVT